ncbi:MAG: hypothetical protein CMK00_06235 [Planctomycetes bacterium]|nr:hypothetical protein [Planctomycetota bacterium]HJO25780.1 toxin-antitoxin system YwqK family antitoxin [Planctomycetota bacterium]
MSLPQSTSRCLPLLLLAACAPDRRTLEFEDGTVFLETTWDGEHLEGPFRQWYPGGAPERELHYRDGERSGEWIWWYENGQEKRRGSFVDGWRDGLWSAWHENGQLQFQGEHEAGQKIGTWRGWYDAGSPSYEETWEAGTRTAVKRFPRPGG